MNLRSLVLIASLFMAQPVFARIIDIRSGEHNTFSRIVLNIPTGTNWTLTQTGRQAELSLQLPDIQFDTSQVFSRIPRSRLLGLTQVQPGKALQITMGCLCKAVGFLQDGTLLVIDIHDPKTPISSPSLTLGATPVLRFSNVTPLASHSPIFKWKLKPETSIEIAEPASFAKPRPTSVIDLPTQENLTNVNASELRLLSQIDRATAQGLLHPNLDISNPVNDNAILQIGENDTHERHQRIDTPSTVSMTVISSMDRDLADDRGHGQLREDQLPCLPVDLVNLPDWGNTLSFGTQIGSRRSHLYGEFDNINQQSVIELTKNLLFFGFGAEARTTLNLFTGEDSKRQVLTALAEIMDNGHIVTRNPFVGQSACNNDVALWAYLALSDASTSEESNPEAILTAFARLPHHLRVLLGPLLVGKFSKSGDIQSMDIVSRTAARALNRSDPALDLAQANANMQHGDPIAAVDQMAAIAQSGTEYSPQALIDLVIAQTEADQTVSPDIPDLIAAYELEHRKSDLGPALQQAHILSLAITGRFSEAFKNYYEQSSDDSNSSKDYTLTQILTILTKRADDITFLRYTLFQIEQTKSNFPVELQNLLAARLIEQGFSSQASIVLAGQEGQESGDRRLMNAQIAITENLPRRALVELFGASGAQADGIRAQAFLDIGEYENAGISQEASGTDPGRSFWHAEDWDAVIRQKDSPFSEPAILAKSLRDSSDIPEDRGSLAYAREIENSSLATRSDISDLLNIIGPLQ